MTGLLEPRVGASRMGALAVPGVKFRGVNLVPKPNGPRGATGSDGNPANYGTQDWPDVWSEWDWTGWIKPQVDAAKTAGANAIRIIGGASIVLYNGTAPTDWRAQTLATYLARCRQLFEYARSIGLRVYACGGGIQEFPTGFTQAALIAVLQPWAALCDQYEHIIGLDLLQEPFHALNAGKGPAGVATTAALNTYLSAVLTAVRPYTTLPLTFSSPSIVNTSSTVFSDANNTTVAAYVDFLDFHVYYTPAGPGGSVGGDIDAALGYGKPVLIGETGSPVSAGATARAAFYKTFGEEVLRRPEIAGGFSWAITDQQPDTNTTGQYGLYTSAFVARPVEVAAFQSWPTKDSAEYVHKIGMTVGTYTFPDGDATAAVVHNQFTMTNTDPLELVIDLAAFLQVPAGVQVRVIANTDISGAPFAAAYLGDTAATGVNQTLVSGTTRPAVLVVPPGTHTYRLQFYRLIGTTGGLISNLANLTVAGYRFRKV